MKTSSQLFLLGVLSTLPAAAAAAEGTVTGQPLADTSEWKCESCKFEEGQSASVDVGVGSVSDKSAKFGEYNGLQKKGEFFIGDGSARFRGADAQYWSVNASNLGLKTRSVDAEVGQQGAYRLSARYDELPHFVSDGALTPFNGTGGPSLTLPPGFPAATTGAMPLATSLNQVNIETQRKRLGVGAAWMPAREWEYSVNVRHETRRGTKRSAGAFFVNSAQLLEPVDYVTDQVDAAASYASGKWQAKLAYYGSVFRDRNEALTWQNPFTPIVGGDTTGRLALPPDNQFHQLVASAGYQFNERTRASSDIAIGRMTQDDGFLPATTNPGFAQVLPRSSLGGRADTLNANLKVSSAVTDRLRLNATLTHDERENRTPQALYPVVSTDMFLGLPRTNLPYSFKQDKVRLSGDYRILERTKASAGIDFDSVKRTFQEASRVHEETAWGRVTSRVFDMVELTFKLAHGERRNSNYQPVAGIQLPENPLLRKYNMSSRTRDTLGLRTDIAATENINIGLGLDSSKDSYPDSPIGLTSARDYNLNGDVTLKVGEDTSVHFFANRQEIKSKQANSQTFSVADWTGENRDTINVAGLGLKHAAIKDKLDVGADYTASRSRSEIAVNTGARDPAFPDLFASLNSLKLYATYRLKDNLSLNASYWHEIFNSRSWMLEGVSPGTIPNVLTLGEQPPRYNLNVVRLSMRYSF